MLGRGGRPTRSRAGIVPVGFGALVALLGLGGVTASASPSPAVLRTVGVVAQRQAYTTDAGSPVVHDTETNALVTQDHRLFAATDQWEYPGPRAYGQILVKNRAAGPWRVFEQTQGLRVEALDSSSIPTDQGLGPGRSLLVTQAVLHGRSEVQWALDGSKAFAASDSYRPVVRRGRRPSLRGP